MWALPTGMMPGFGEMNGVNTGSQPNASQLSANAMQNASQSDSTVPPGYVVVPSAYLQQIQMSITQMYQQISAITASQNSIQQAFQTFVTQHGADRSRPIVLLDQLISSMKASKEASIFKSKSRKNLEQRNRPKKPSKSQKKPDTEKKPTCRFYLSGTCSNDNKCNFSHSGKTEAETELKIYDFSIDSSKSISSNVATANIETASEMIAAVTTESNE